MADNRYSIDEARSRAGRAILKMTDGVGFGAFAAGWVHDRPTNSWRYLLSTPMLKSKGPLWIYRRLMTVFKHTPLPDGVTPLDIFVVDPDYELSLFGNTLFMSEHSKLRGVTNPDIDGIIIAVNQEIRFAEFAVTDGFVSFYRRLSVGERRRQRDPVRTFEHKVKMLEAA